MAASHNPWGASYNPRFEGEPGEARIKFSGREGIHLTVSVAVLAVAFAAFRAKPRSFNEFLHISPVLLGGAALAVGLGFVLHELAHKIVAQRYGHWAEFRAEFAGLLITLFLALFTPILVAAPGAVLIRGRVTPRENGIISIVGPGTNFVIAMVAYPFAWAVDGEQPLPKIMSLVAGINATLCVFNLLPIPPFDGRKVWNWSKVAWTISMLLGVVAFSVIQVLRPHGF